MRTKKITNIFATLSVLEFGFRNHTCCKNSDEKNLQHRFCWKRFLQHKLCCKVFLQHCPCCNNENEVGCWIVVQMTVAEAADFSKRFAGRRVAWPFLYGAVLLFMEGNLSHMIVHALEATKGHHANNG